MTNGIHLEKALSLILNRNKMNIKKILVFTVFSFIISSALKAQLRPIKSDGDLQISYIVKDTASLVDTAWLSLIFQNKGEDSLEIKDFMYMILGEKNPGIVPGISKRITLGQGNVYTTFPQFDFATNPNKTTLILAPGDSIVCWRHLSNYAGVLLGKDGLATDSITAQMRLRIAWKDSLIERYRNDSINFPFLWQPLSGEGDSLLANRIQRALLTDQPKAENWLLNRYLKDTSVNQYLATAKLEQVIMDGKKEMKTFRFPILSILNDRDDASGFFNEYYLSQLADANPDVLYELNFYWDTAFIEPLKEAFLSSKKSTDEYMTVFDRHYEDWAKREGLADTLADRVFEIADQVLVNKNKLAYHQLEAWRIWSEILAKSHAEKAIQYFEKFLNDNRNLDPATRGKFLGNKSVLRKCTRPLRVGDMATDAILLTQGKDLNETFTSTFQMLVEKGILEKPESDDKPDEIGMIGSSNRQYDEKTCALIREEIRKNLE
jgi:hypothetical protein